MKKNILIIEDNPTRFKGLKEALITENLENSKNTLPLFTNYNIFPSDYEYKYVCETIKKFASTYYNNKDNEKNKTIAMKALSELYFYIFKLIEDNEITLLFSDLSLSMDEEQGETTGEKLIEKIFQNKLHEKLPVIVYSRHGKDSSYLKKKNILPKIFSYICSDSTTSDPAELRGLINGGISDFRQLEEFISRYKEREYNYNLGIICALEIEYKYVKELFSEEFEETIKDHKPYDVGYLENTEDGKIIKLVIRSMGGEYGRSQAKTGSDAIINLFKPEYIAMTGVAGGHMENVNLGDIAIVKHAFEWEAVKYESDIMIPRYTPQVMDKSLKNTIKEFFIKDSEKGDFLQNILDTYPQKEAIRSLINDEVEKDKKDNEKNPHSGNLKCRFAPVSTGSGVVDSEKMMKNIYAAHGKSLGLDMESHSVYESAYDAIGIGTRAIVIKGIVDYGDGTKGKEWQEFSSYASAKILYKLFAEYIYDDVKGSQ